MSDRKRFVFTGIDVDYETKIGFQVNLGETPDLSNLDQLFEDLYAQWRVDPQYLFVSKKDIGSLTDQVARGTNFCGPFGKSYADGERLSMRRLYEHGLTKYINQTTGKLIDVVPLPGLASSHVIIGFFN